MHIFCFINGKSRVAVSVGEHDVTCVQQVSERLLLVPQTELLRALQIEPAVLLLGWAGMLRLRMLFRKRKSGIISPAIPTRNTV